VSWPLHVARSACWHPRRVHQFSQQHQLYSWCWLRDMSRNPNLPLSLAASSQSQPHVSTPRGGVTAPRHLHQHRLALRLSSTSPAAPLQHALRHTRAPTRASSHGHTHTASQQRARRSRPHACTHAWPHCSTTRPAVPLQHTQSAAPHTGACCTNLKGAPRHTPVAATSTRTPTAFTGAASDAASGAAGTVAHSSLKEYAQFSSSILQEG
jgi:hypothetical protein